MNRSYEPGISQDNLSGNVVSDFQVNHDNTVFTFTIGEGLRWLVAYWSPPKKGWAGYQEILMPAHYLRPYHVAYTPLENLLPEMEAQGMEDWYQLFNHKSQSIPLCRSSFRAPLV